MPDLLPLAHLLDGSPAAVRAVVGLLGLALLLRGARWYEASIRLGAFGAGAVVGVGAVRAASLWFAAAWQPVPILAASLVAGVIFTLVTLATHRLVLVGLGALVGLAAGLGVQAIAGGLAWWAPVAGLVLGLVLFPLLYRKLLPLTTSAMGAVLVAHAAGIADDVLLVAAIGLVGTLIQLRRPSPREDEG